MDVPPGIVALILLFLLVLFVPLVAITPDLPSALPPLRFDAAAVRAWHAAARRASGVPDYLDESFAAFGRALALRDSAATAAAQREFAAFLLDAAADGRAERDAIREHHLALFLRAVDAGRPEPLVLVARRHRLAGPEADPGVSREMLVAWFDLRWEAAAARESLRGESVPLEALVARLPAPERRAAVAWALYADCHALLGAPPGALRAVQLRRCAEVRQNFAGLAHLLDRGYPVSEARAAIEVLYARALERAARQRPDPAEREDLASEARAAYGRANALYAALAAEQPSRRLRRYLLGSAAGMND